MEVGATMSAWDKFCYYVGLAGLIGIPIVLVVEVVRFGPQQYMLRGVFALVVFGIAFHQGRQAKRVIAQRVDQDRQKPN